MAACLIPKSSTVLVALEHLLELDKQLKSEEVSFSDDAGHNLREISDALTEVEASRRDARERLEVETIETSKLRCNFLRLHSDVTNEIADGVAAARNSNIAVINQLQSDIKCAADDIEMMRKQQELLEKQNETFLSDREFLKSIHEDAVNELNQHLSEKASKQISLSETMDQVCKLQEQMVNVKIAQEELKNGTGQVMLTFTEQKKDLQKEIDESLYKLQEQEKKNSEKHVEVERVTTELLNEEQKITEHTSQIAKTERSIVRLRAAKQQHERQLHEETAQALHLANQKVFFEKELAEVQESFEKKIKVLQEHIVKVEREIADARAVNEQHKWAVTTLQNQFSAQKKEELETRAGQENLRGQLDKSKLSLEEQTVSVTKLKAEIRRMEEDMKQQHRSKKTTTGLWSKNVELLEEQLSREEKIREAMVAEKHEVCRTLERLRVEHEEHVKKVTDVIALSMNKQGELREEKNKWEEQLRVGSVVEELRRRLRLAEEQYESMEAAYTTEIKGLMRESELIQKKLQKEEQKMKIKEAVLKDAELKFEMDWATNQTWRKRIAELESQKTHLETSIQHLKDQTTALLKPKEDLQLEIRALNAQHVELLTVQAAELSTIERNIYESSLRLEQVNLENSRLHMCIEHMKKDMHDTNRQRDRHSREAAWLKDELQSLLGNLLKAWEMNGLVTKEYGEKDQAVLQAIKQLRSKVNERKNKAEDILDGARTLVEATEALWKSTK